MKTLDATSPPPAPSRRAPARPRSTIARLPHPVRDFINHALREGQEYIYISAHVAILIGTDKPRLSQDMLSRWFRTGYQDWLREQTQLQSTIAQNTAALTQLASLHAKTGLSISDLTDALLASALQKILQDFDPASLQALLVEKPAEFFRLVSCLNAHIAARSRDKTAEVARARCQVELAGKAQSSRQTPDSSKLLYEKQMVDQFFGGPLEKLNRAFREDAPDPKRKKSSQRRAQKSEQSVALSADSSLGDDAADDLPNHIASQEPADLSEATRGDPQPDAV